MQILNSQEFSICIGFIFSVLTAAVSSLISFLCIMASPEISEHLDYCHFEQMDFGSYLSLHFPHFVFIFSLTS
jgi:hypothetical protein